MESLQFMDGVADDEDDEARLEAMTDTMDGETRRIFIFEKIARLWVHGRLRT